MYFHRQINKIENYEQHQKKDFIYEMIIEILIYLIGLIIQWPQEYSMI